MESNVRLLILDLGQQRPESGATSSVGRALDSVLASGATFRHSSGRIVVVEVAGDQASRLTGDLPGARVVPLDANVSELIPDLDTNELLFLEAVRIRHSAAYQAEKAQQKPGESPEEQLMFTAPCIPGGQSNG
ncbi:hypothetical protein GY21_07470 [Cryobacterium roopkundense]|uniref:Uncharacterized protein n=1 Tax=Cryobacterium roopkundense TaxID=1001240 RepID=A0A099JHI6_9MICO|nr:hypothetical protein [Cryobacterium roopkundense]KGJ77535.1 hypothetical protein GY21_07470 [Cryobacterium roopkundense]MBB5640741.1 hypothetical protein [Cryobacterium roopkundense]